MEIPRDDFSKEELLALEKETLGLYVSSHPLKDIRHQVRREAGHLISQLGEVPDGKVTTIVGMIGTVKRITTKKSGEMMAFVTVEGLEGSVEIVCFPAIYQENKELLVEDKVVKIKGRVDHKDEAETKFIPLAIEAFTPKTGPGAAGARRWTAIVFPAPSSTTSSASWSASPACARWTCTCVGAKEPGVFASAMASGWSRRPACSPN